jgi:hypothetical protein
VNARGDWVTVNSQKTLWLPPDYRPARDECVAMYNSIIAIGCSSGYFFFLQFKEEEE